MVVFGVLLLFVLVGCLQEDEGFEMELSPNHPFTFEIDDVRSLRFLALGSEPAYISIHENKGKSIIIAENVHISFLENGEVVKVTNGSMNVPVDTLWDMVK